MRKDISGVIVSVISIITSILILLNINMSFAIPVLVIGLIVASVFCWRVLKNESPSSTDDVFNYLNQHKNDNAHPFYNDDGTSVILNKKQDFSNMAICLSEIPATFRLVGRENEMDEVFFLLSKLYIVALRGEGGIGKTAIAATQINMIKNFCHQKRKYDYKHVAWIHSSDDIVNDFLKIGIHGTDLLTDNAEKKKHIINWLQQNPTFIVIDHLDHLLSEEETDFLNTIVGKTSFGITSVLITTRVEITQFKEYLLKPLSKKHAIKLFKKFYYRDTQLSLVDNFDISDEKAIEKLVGTAEYNPLLIELLSKQAYWKHQSLKSLLEQVECIFNNRLENQEDEISDKISHLYEMVDLPDEQRELIEFFTIFPANIPIFFDIFKLANIEHDNLKYLTEHGWIIRTSEGYMLHSIVRNSLNLQPHSLLNREKILGNKRLIEYLANTDVYMPLISGYKDIERRIHVLEAFCEFLRDYILIDSKVASLFNSLGQLLSQLGDNEEALEYFLKTLEARKELLGINHIDTAISYRNVAKSYMNNCNFKMALDCYKKSLEIQEKIPDTKKLDSALTCADIAITYIKQSKYDEALQYYNKALEICENDINETYTIQIMLYNNLGLITDSVCRHIDAMKYYMKALSICKKELDSEHPLAAMTHHNIACLCQKLGRYEEALKHYNKALAAREKVLGKNHPDTASSYNDLASLYQEQGYEQKALKYYYKALAIREKRLCKNHIDTAIVYRNLSYLFCDQGEYERAQRYCLKGLSICEKTVGTLNIETARTYNVLAGIYMDQGDYEKALQYYSRELEIYKKTLIDGNIETAKLYKSLAILYGRLNKYEDAQKYCLVALNTFKDVFGENHPEVGKTYINLAFLSGSRGNLDEATENCLIGLEILKKSLGNKNPETATAYNNLAIFKNEQGNYAEALTFCHMACEIRESLLGKDHPDTARTYSTLAVIYKKLGDEEKAYQYYLKMKASKGFRGMEFSNSDTA